MSQDTQPQARWLIFFHDQDHGHELFTEETAARRRLADCKIARPCDLFVHDSVTPTERKEPMSEPTELVERIDALYANRTFGPLIVQPPTRHDYSRDLIVERAEGVTETVAHSVRVPDAHLHAALVNEWPSLKSALKKLAEENERLQSTLKTVYKNRDAIAHGEKTALGLMAIEKSRAEAAEEKCRTLEAEVERLKKERDESRMYSQRYVDKTDQLIACATEEPFTCGTCRACYIQRAEAAEEKCRTLEAEVERLNAAMSGDATLAGLHYESHGAAELDIGIKHPLIALMADSLAKMIGDHNYVEMRMQHRETGDEYLMHCQRLARPTPHELRQRAESALAQAQGKDAEGCTPVDIEVLRKANVDFAGENQRLRQALRFYAHRQHFWLSDPNAHAWDTVSGEPPNFWCDEAGTATVEDGTVAAMALRGDAIDWEDEEPLPIEGEPECEAIRALKSPQEPKA